MDEGLNANGTGARFLLQRLRQLEKALETMQIGVTITDAQGRIVFVNRADARMHGYEVEELVGKEAWLLAPAELRRSDRSSDLRGISSWSRESVNVRKDGSRFPVLITSDVVRDAEGHPVGLVTCCQDISERRMAEKALRDSEARFALAVAGANDGIWDWDLRTGAVYYSPRWMATVGATTVDAPATSDLWFSRVHPADLDRLRERIERHITGETPHLEDEHRLLHSDGSYRWVRCRGVAVRDELGSALRMGGSLADITDLKALDPLTGLPNRGLLEDRLAVCVARARRRRERTFAVLFIDLDRFKVVNDSLGHLTGDQLLLSVARRIESSVRPGDTVARFGGDEFIVLLDDIRTRSEALRIAQRLHEALEPPFLIQGRSLFVTASIGIVVHSRRRSHPGELLSDADLAMYHAKLQGGASTRVFDASLRQAASHRLHIENGLRSALEHGRLRLHYQPIVRLASGEIVGFEALVRWVTQDDTMLLPQDFLPTAEETGLIVPIGLWVMREACRQMNEWHQRFPSSPLLAISINVAARQIVQRDFVQQVRRVLRETGLDPRSLLLEITETTMLQQEGPVVATLERLRKAGIRICVDDFGTGYSSLVYLQNLPIDILKIDQCFVQRLGGSPRSSDLVRAILKMGEDLGLGVIAEGIESTEQRESLVELQCGLGQGFGFSTPIDAEAATDLLARRNAG